MLRAIAMGVLALALCGCASHGGGTKDEVNAVVLDEKARAAATQTAAQGEGSKAALDAGEAAADPKTAKPRT